MNLLSCEEIGHHFSSISEVEDFESTTIASCVFNTVLSYTAIMLNIVTIHAIRKSLSLPMTLKTLLLSLAVSDAGVGLLGQPILVSILVNWLQQNNPGCNMYRAFIFNGHLFSSASFLSVVAVSLDRFLAIHLHLRYQELVTHKRVVAVVILIWVWSLFASFSMMWLSLAIFSLIAAVIGIFGFLLTTMVYIRIYSTVRRHKNQIQALQVQQRVQAGEGAAFAGLISSAGGVFYVYLVFLICYLPFYISLVVYKSNDPNVTMKKFFLFALTLLYLNSSLNPVMYCWKMKHIRQAVINILRDMTWLRSRASHETLPLSGHTMQ